MLNKVNRLRKKYQFNYVYKAGEHYTSKNLVLYVTQSKTKSIKVGICVTKKVGHAVKRNLVRRRLREIVKKQLPVFKQNYNIVLLARDGILEANFANLEAEFLQLSKKANLFIDEKDI